FCNKKIVVMISHEDVSLALKVESLTNSRPVVLAVQLNQIMKPDVLFFHLGEGTWATLHHHRHIFDDAQNTLVMLFQQCQVGGWPGGYLHRRRRCNLWTNCRN